MIRLGVIGSGRIATRFVPETKYVDDICVEVIYNPHLKGAKKLAIENRVQVYTDEERTLFANCDAVYIATPHNTHYEYIKKSLNAGKHVLCEKPMVLKHSEAEEVFKLAAEKELVLMEALKTAYAPGFLKVLEEVNSRKIGRIYDVEACFTKLVPRSDAREFCLEENGGSFTELGSYPLLAIEKVLGKKYKSIEFMSVLDENGVDLYTKAIFRYENAMAQIKVGLGIKSEGNLLISGTNGYVLAESPWWMTKKFEICYEDREQNEVYNTEYHGQGLRYEIESFVSKILCKKAGLDKDDIEFSIWTAEIMEMYLTRRKNHEIETLQYI